MAIKKSFPIFTKLLFLLVVILGVVILVLFYKKETMKKSMPSLLTTAATWYPSARWSQPENDTQTTLYGKFTGESIHATITTQQAMLNHFEDVHALKQKGFLPDTNLSADGPGSSVWGYSNNSGTTKQIILFSYNVKPSNTNPNQPVQFNCPCATTLTVFLGTSVAPTAALANPASVNCVNKGGTLSIQKNGTGGEYGLCDFGDNMQCEEWALFRSDCPVGGIKTTGFDTIAQKYCAWLGGKTFAVPNATCALPNGHVCNDTALYNGTCQ